MSYRQRRAILYRILMVLTLFISLLIVTGSSYAQCTSGLTNYWKLDESSGSTFVDSVGGVNASCSAPNCPQFSAGIIGNALMFDGSNSGINVSPNASFNWGNSDSFSIEFWMQTDPVSSCTGSQVLVGREDSSTNLHWWVGCKDGGQAAFSLFDKSGVGVSIAGTKDLTNSTWHHIAAVRDTSTGEIRLYVDGINEASQLINFADGFDSAVEGLNIGWLNLGGGYHFQGVADEVALYNRALSEGEIRSHYYLAKGYCDLCANPVRIMPLGDSITSGVGTGDGTAATRTGYRQPLNLSLLGGGYHTDFVGSLQAGQSATPSFDVDNEGHGGWTSSEVAGQVFNWLSNNPADVALLHIGTNDLNIDPSTDPSNVESILNEIDRYDQRITVILAHIIDKVPYSAATTTFNNNVQAMAQNRIASGDKIIMVDEESALDYSVDMFDNLHPNEGGYNKMANIWMNSLSTFLPATFLPVCGGPVITSTPVTAAVVGQPYTYDVNASGNPAPGYSLIGTPPSGMAIDPTTGLIQWTPTAMGTFDVTVKADNGAGSDTQNFTINVVSVTINAPSVMYNADGVVTVTVSSVLGTPTGNVSLTVDGGAAVTQTLNIVSGSIPPSSSATFTITKLRAGTHTLNASFASQGSFVASPVNGILTVFARPLAITATAANRMYDSTTTVSVTYSDDRLTGDVLTVSGAASFADKSVGTAKAVTITNITITGIDSGNYALTATTASTTADIIAPDGDLDGSGVSVTDALRALRIAGGLIIPTAADSSHGDVAPLVSGIPQPDDSIDIGDVVVILRKTVGLVNW